MNPSHRTRVLALLVSLLVVAGFLVTTAPRSARAANPPPVQTYFLSVPAAQSLNIFQAVNASSTQPVFSYTSIAIGAGGTLIYYDHWENGFVVDLANPTPAETYASPGNLAGVQIWGDNDPSNGIPPGFATDVLNAGDVIVLSSEIPLPRVTTDIRFDGSDRFGATRSVAVVRSQFADPSTIRTLLSFAHELYPTNQWGTAYTAPVGCNVPTATAGSMFEYAALSVMAGFDGTPIEIDSDNDGIYEVTGVTLNKGEAYLEDGYDHTTGCDYVRQGAKVRSTDPAKPIQVQLFIGDIEDDYEIRDITLVPDANLSNDYYSPVGFTSQQGNGATSGPARLWLYNPNASTIYVRCELRPPPTPNNADRTIAAGAVATVDVPDFSAAHCYATDSSFQNPAASIFTGLVTMDASTSTSGGNARTWDWSATLLPTAKLSNITLVGLGLGRDPTNTTDSLNQNGNPIWVTPACTTGTFFYVDWDRDNVPDLVDLNGDGDTNDTIDGISEATTNNGIPVSYLQSVRLFKPGTGPRNQTGAFIYTRTLANNQGGGGCKFAAAWGQDPRIASAAQPGLDVGTTVLPVIPIEVGKEYELLNDVDNDGVADPGDTIRYTITITNIGLETVEDLKVFDEVPVHTAYVTGTTAKDLSGNGTGPWVAIPDDGVGTPFPLDVTGGVLLGNLPAGQFFKVRFNVTLNPITSANNVYDIVTNCATAIANEVELVACANTDVDTDPAIDVEKSANPTTVTEPGGPVDFTVRIDNPGPIPIIIDSLVDDKFGDLDGQGTCDVTPPINLSVGSFYECTFQGNVIGVASDVHTNKVTASGKGVNDKPVSDDDTADVTIIAPPPTGKIGDRVWYDLDGDGVQDPNEPGIVGVPVKLTPPAGVNIGAGAGVPVTILTGADGSYLFENLPAGTYTVEVTTPPAGLTNTGDPDGPSPNGDSKSTVVLAAGQEKLDQDFGYQPEGKIGDTVWYDINGDGVQDPGEPGIPGIQVKLEADYDKDGTIDETLTKTTDANGNYLFENLPPGNYTVTVVNPPAGLAVTGDPDATKDGQSQLTLTSPTEVNLDQDFAYQPQGKIGDRIWYDMNGDGVQDATEPGIPGIEVKLEADYDKDGTVDATFTKTTGPDGFYLFENLPPGNYKVTVNTPPAGMPVTGDPDATKDGISTLNLPTATSENLLQDFGYQPQGKIGDTIFNDDDGNGAQNGGETGIPNIQVKLEADYNKDGTTDATFFDTTDGNGNYLFENLPPGNYSVTVMNPPPSAANTADPDGGNDNTSALTLTANEVNLDQDFGYQDRSGIIGDTIWYDIDGDGSQDPNEPGVPGITVQLTPPANVDLGAGPGVPVTKVTDANGKYEFKDLPPGSYTVTVLNPPAGLQNSGDPDGPSPNGDSTSAVTLLPGEANLIQDFGYRPQGQIGDTIWYDMNGDGVQNPGEPGVPGIVVKLEVDYDKDGTIDATFTQTTGPDGKYLFENLPPGNYTVTVNTPPAGLVVTGDPDPVKDGKSQLTLNTPTDVNLDQDFGYRPKGKIGDTIFYDLDGNGSQDLLLGETGIPNIDIKLEADFDQDGTIDATFTTTTDGNGKYLFENLPPGDYKVTVLNPPPGTNTADPDGGGNSTSSLNLATPTSVNLDQDFGYQPPSVCPIDGDYVDFVETRITGQGVFPNTGGTVPIPSPNQAIGLYAQLAGKKTPKSSYTYAQFMPYQTTTRLDTLNDTSLESKEYRDWAIFWFGQDLSWFVGNSNPAQNANRVYARLQVSAGSVSDMPRALILYTDFPTDVEYFNRVDRLADSKKNHVHWSASFIKQQQFTVNLPAPLTETRDILVQSALVDNDSDKRPLVLTISLLNSNGNVLVTKTFSPIGPDSASMLNMIRTTFNDAPVGTSSVLFKLESPFNTGDSGSLVGTGVSYPCIDLEK